jgi:cation diffusion facilitator family transporter
MALKALAYWWTGSIGVLSDAVESLVNLLAAATALLALSYAARPVDPSHTYGHEKIEFFSSGLEGILILLAAGGIAWYALTRLLAPAPLEPLSLATLLAMSASIVINLVVAQILLCVGRARNSIVLEADGQHLMTDVWTSVGVIAGVILVERSQVYVLDPLIALLVAANIVWTGIGLVMRSFNGLMDHALPEVEQAKIRTTLAAHLGTGLHFHALRTRQAGARRFVDFHLLVPGAWPVRRAHDLAGKLEDAIAGVLPDVEITIHIEPIEEPASWQDSALLGVEVESKVNDGDKK